MNKDGIYINGVPLGDTVNNFSIPDSDSNLLPLLNGEPKDLSFSLGIHKESIERVEELFSRAIKAEFAQINDLLDKSVDRTKDYSNCDCYNLHFEYGDSMDYARFIVCDGEIISDIILRKASDDIKCPAVKIYACPKEMAEQLGINIDEINKERKLNNLK